MGHDFLYDWSTAPWRRSDPGDGGSFNETACAYYPMVLGATSETATLPAPAKEGLMVILSVDTAGGGTRTVTVTNGYNQDEETSIAFSDARDMAVFFSIKVGTAYRWALIAEEGTTATTEDLSVDTATITTATITTGTITDETVTNSTITTADVTTATIDTLNLGYAAVNAAGNVIGNAAALASGFSVVDGADNTKGVQLPVATAGQVVAIRSSVAAKTLEVYPQVNAAIDALGANNAYTMAAATTGGSAIFIAAGAAQWWSFPGEID